MPFDRGLPDLIDAFESGRFHWQRFFKNASASALGAWADFTFASGQPAYNSRVGTPLAFTPLSNVSNNNGIYTGPVPSSRQTKHLIDFTMRPNVVFVNQSIVIYDMVGYYPIIDGDSTDVQIMTNDLTLPRYTTGDGLIMVLMNHVTNGSTSGTATINYIDQDGTAKTTPTFRYSANSGLGCIANSNSPTSLNLGALGIPLANGSRGVRSVTSFTYSIIPGGLQVLCLLRVLATCISNLDLQLATEKSLSLNAGFSYPRIYDGAAIGIMHLGTAGATNFGNMTFAWG